jgi:hypothetical protein
MFYSIQEMSPLAGDLSTRAWGINRYGEVVGESSGHDSSEGDEYLPRLTGMVWIDGSPEATISPETLEQSGDSGEAELVKLFSINDNHNAVGWFQFKPFLVDHAKNNSVEFFNPLLPGIVAAINNSGLICGPYYDGPKAFIFDSMNNSILFFINPLPSFATCRAIAISKNGDVVGTCDTPAGDASTRHGFYYRYSTAEITDLGPAAFVEDIVERNGEIIIVGSVWHKNADVECTPQIWKGSSGSFTSKPIPLPEGGFTGGRAHGVNSSGNVVGECWLPGDGPKIAFDPGDDAYDLEDDLVHSAFIYDHTVHKSFDLNDQIVTDTAWELQSAQKINKNGQIAGNGLLNGVPRGFQLFNPQKFPPVPQPRAVTIVSLGVPVDGGGTARPGGHVDPWGPLTVRPSIEKQDAILGLVIDEIAMNLQDRTTRVSIRRAALGATLAQVKQFLTTLQTDVAQDKKQ